MLRTVAAFLARGAIAIACATMWLGSPLQAELLYITEFESPFLTGPDNWRGTEGWLANNNGLGVHGIDNDKLPTPPCEEPPPCPPPDQTAFLGGAQPATHLVVVAKPLNHEPSPTTKTVVIDTLMGIQDSTNGNYDSFWVGVYNIGGNFLAGLRFNVDFSTVRRHDGVQEFPIQNGGFLLNEHQLLCIEVDFQKNRWKVDVDGIALFPWHNLTSTALPRDLGSVSYEWQVNAASTADYGDNWMIVLDCIIWAIPPGEPLFHIDQIQFGSGGQPELEFTAEPGWTYQVQYSENLVDWDSNLPGSNFSGFSEPTQVFFTDSTHNSATTGWYRVKRSVTP